MENNNSSLDWTFGVFLIFLGIAIIFVSSIPGGIFFLAAGLILTPNSLKYIERKTGRNLTFSQRIIAICILLATALFLTIAHQVAKGDQEKLAKQKAFDEEVKKARADSLAFRALPDSVKSRIRAEKEKEQMIQDKIAEHESKYYAESRRMNKFKQQLDPSDSSHRGLTKFIKENMHDPSSYEHVKTSYKDEGDLFVLECIYRGKNKLGAMVLSSIMVRVDAEGNVVQVLDTK